MNYQCVLCGHYWEAQRERPKQCPDCGCKQIREVQKGNMDAVAPESVAHIRKKVENCWNYDVDPRSGAQSYHPLRLIQELDVTKANSKLPVEVAQVTITQRCSRCGMLYGQQIVPLSRSDILERLGLLAEVEAKTHG
jgi:DNA-directed RNA polymerase subunit RPC12/RpoP